MKEGMIMTSEEIRRLTLWITLIGTAAWAFKAVRQATR
jgi:hypothetical protein